MKINGTWITAMEENKFIFTLKPPFAVLEKDGAMEIKPLVMCRDCKHWYAGCTKGHDCPDGGKWFCADGEKRGE